MGQSYILARKMLQGLAEQGVAYDDVKGRAISQLDELVLFEQGHIAGLLQFLLQHKPRGHRDRSLSMAGDFLTQGIGQDLLMDDEYLLILE